MLFLLITVIIIYRKENNSAAVAVPKQPLVNKARALIRRPAVSAESFDPNKLKEILSQLTIVPKSPEVDLPDRSIFIRSNEPNPYY